MSTPIHMLYLIKRKQAWYALSDEARGEIGAQTVDATTRAGGKRLLLCDATWSSGECEFFEITEFPDLAAAQKRIELYEKVELFRYYEIITVIGTQMEHYENIPSRFD